LTEKAHVTLQKARNACQGETSSLLDPFSVTQKMKCCEYAPKNAFFSVLQKYRGLTLTLATPPL
jgi:hypothetical protein